MVFKVLYPTKGRVLLSGMVSVKFTPAKGLTLIEMLISLGLTALLLSSVTYILLNPLKLTFGRLQSGAEVLRYQEGLRQMQNDLFYGKQINIVASKVQGLAPDGQIFSYEETPKGLKRVLGQSTAYFTLPSDPPQGLIFSWQKPGLLKITDHTQTILLQVRP